ncbi:MAG: glycosyltransferase family 2 protein [Acidobacteria bacterium]|nr:glycosyltransferase family 2 protein [Acidobacteriota bacterium]
MTPERGAETNPVEVSIVIPCLNEAATIGACIDAAIGVLQEHDIAGEVVVADSSTDDSPIVAASHGARVVRVDLKGYGNGLMGGIGSARGGYIIMADADGQHDFQAIPELVARLRGGAELAQGCRLPSGGGRIMPGAMKWSHRWIGNPLFSLLSRWWYRSPVHDVNCGFRGFTRGLYERLDLQCTGMEFAAEMILKASLLHARIAEVPITVYPDRRVVHRAHLRTFRDGWRALRFFLLYTPRWLFLMPGLLLWLVGAGGYAVAWSPAAAGEVSAARALLLSSACLLCGYQSVIFAIFAKTFAVSERLLPEDPKLTRFYELVTLEKGLLSGAAALVAGVVLLACSGQDLSRAVAGATVTILGFQTMISSFLVSIIGLRRR